MKPKEELAQEQKLFPITGTISVTTWYRFSKSRAELTITLDDKYTTMTLSDEIQMMIGGGVGVEISPIKARQE